MIIKWRDFKKNKQIMRKLALVLGMVLVVVVIVLVVLGMVA